ncbi:hypothetical protein NDU88_005034 [Pleurodeles waltl]|uniref:Uncharacterized protein n=1 Tax=Pleurodeles waltl TaxID=8319 RepID=A0AAV7L1Y1_PLEWA|nr:hypothetical protein NDU88_005034 [Pleurodeles waltl]
MQTLRSARTPVKGPAVLQRAPRGLWDSRSAMETRALCPLQHLETSEDLTPQERGLYLSKGVFPIFCKQQ